MAPRVSKNRSSGALGVECTKALSPRGTADAEAPRGAWIVKHRGIEATLSVECRQHRGAKKHRVPEVEDAEARRHQS
ncbi:UNVERIFIED_CONTAM: hypothetical protein FKN15_018054 [Acipenser sinensis]